MDWACSDREVVAVDRDAVAKAVAVRVVVGLEATERWVATRVALMVEAY